MHFRAGLGKNSGQAKKNLKQDVTYHLKVGNPYTLILRPGAYAAVPELLTTLRRAYQSRASEWYYAQAGFFMAIAGAMTRVYCVPRI